MNEAQQTMLISYMEKKKKEEFDILNLEDSQNEDIWMSWTKMASFEHFDNFVDEHLAKRDDQFEPALDIDDLTEQDREKIMKALEELDAEDTIHVKKFMSKRVESIMQSTYSAFIISQKRKWLETNILR